MSRIKPLHLLIARSERKIRDLDEKKNMLVDQMHLGFGVRSADSLAVEYCLLLICVS